MQPYAGVSYASVNEQMYITKHQNELLALFSVFFLASEAFCILFVIGRHKSDTDILVDISLSGIGL